MGELPKVSIVTPSLNQGQFIERTILSVLNQNYPNIEYIVMDGGSTDNTIEILRKYEDRLIWKSEPDKGQSEAINKGFRMAIGEIFAWLNSDDSHKTDTISTAVMCLGKNPQIDMLYGNGHLIDEEDHVIGEYKSTPMDLRATLYHGRINIFQPSVFFRKSVFKQIGPLDENLQITMDIDYWIRIAMCGLNTININQPLANLRWHQGTKTWQTLGRHKKYHLLLLKKYGVGPYLFFLIMHIVLSDIKRFIFGDKMLLNRKKEGGQNFRN